MMRQRSVSNKLWKGSEGSMAVVIALSMVGLLGLASLAIDVGQIYTERSEMQNTSDAAAMAAARALIVEDTVNRDISRDYVAAQTAANNAIKTEALNRGLTWDPTGYDISIKFANWADHASGGGTWTEIAQGSVNTSNANAVEVAVTRSSDKTGSTYTHSLRPGDQLPGRCLRQQHQPGRGHQPCLSGLYLLGLRGHRRDPPGLAGNWN